jgi:site-specific recombinase XerD
MFKKQRHQARLSDRRARGDLNIINAVFVSDLRARGYSLATIGLYRQAVENCGDWLKAQGTQIGDFGEDSMVGFVGAYAAKCRRHQWAVYRVQVCRRALQRWLLFLRRQGLAQPASHPWSTPQERLLRAYDCYLAQVAGLAVGTRRNHQVQAQRFLQWLDRKDRKQRAALKPLGPQEVIRYVTQCARLFPAPTARNMASGLRCFLRFLAWTKRSGPYLDQVVPTLAPWPRGDLPQGLAEREYRRFLASFDRATALGCRDYALALCLGELGLRASEAAALKLEDLDWRRGVLHLPQTKQRRERQLPLPPQVARSISRYLQRGRPRSNCRAVFVRHRPPVDQALSRSQIGLRMSRAFGRSRLSARGAHVLRYCLATRWQRHGVGLKCIADLLGHQSLESTARYARVDFEALRQAVLPWPEAGR